MPCFQHGARQCGHHVGHELVGYFSHRLQAPGDKRAPAHGDQCEKCDEDGGDHHEQAGIGERSVDTKHVKFDEALDLKLMHGIGQASAATPVLSCFF